ncbi:methylated-DNA-cysteine [Cordyceps militaris]|uniref:Methylated-DNA--protein-cysteine methyltransferase n=1 Tax=Cordyceps militaris TaxID=73501 RepID=A0A2H4SDR7_CORMI|nr:methylated-DNA-cysteine [Cordyceps militaris]
MATRITMYTPANPHGITTITTILPSSSLTTSEAALLTPFQQRVFHLLQQIPAGRVTTYGSMARALRTSPRAVGNALRNNVFAPRIPCHRCVAATGYVNGYDGEVVERSTFCGAAGGARVAGKASQSRGTKPAAVAAAKKLQPPSGTNIQKKLDLLREEGVEFDDRGMLLNKYKVLFDGPWHVLTE